MTCDHVVLEVRCDLPEGHHEDIEHHIEMPLPPDLNVLIDRALETMEDAVARYNRSRRFMWFAVILNLGAAAFGAWNLLT